MVKKGKCSSCVSVMDHVTWSSAVWRLIIQAEQGWGAGFGHDLTVSVIRDLTCTNDDTDMKRQV